MIKSLKELSQIIAAAGISASQEEQILTAVKNLPSSQEVVKEEEFHEQHQAEAKEPWTTFDGELSLEPEIEEFLTCLSVDPLCIQETNHLEEDYLHGMIKEDIQSGPHEKVNQEQYDYIELWFQKSITSEHHHLLQQLLVSDHLQLMVVHAFVYIKVHISNLSMNVFSYLLRTWLHWKYAYT
jgi:hypothetical protein